MEILQTLPLPCFENLIELSSKGSHRHLLGQAQIDNPFATSWDVLLKE